MKKAGKSSIASRAKKPRQKSPAKATVLRLKREQAKLSQGDIARRLKLSTSQYSRIERNPEGALAWQIKKIAEIVGVPIAELFADVGVLEGNEGVGLARLYRAVPIMELTELGSRGKRQSNSARQYVVPTQPVSTEAFGVEIKNGANAHSGPGWRLNVGDRAICDPKRQLAPGDPVIAEVKKTGEIVIGAYLPMHTSNPDAPGFTVKPKNPHFDEVRCTRQNPGEILGKIVERSERFA